MKKLLRIIGWLLLLPVLACATLLGWSAYANLRAEAAAGDFCATIKPGSQAQAALDRASAGSIRVRGMASDQQLDFVFQGAVFNAALCRVQMRQGQVVSTQVVMDGD